MNRLALILVWIAERRWLPFRARVEMMAWAAALQERYEL